MEEKTLWSVRNVAEYAYCPRLFYLMEVEGIRAENTDTVKGLAVHSRVDRVTRTCNIVSEDSGELDDNSPRIIRSLALSDYSLGIAGTLDLAEINGNYAVPVEYRKGHPNRSGKGAANENSKREPLPWPIDRVQIGLQCLLLQSAGYIVEKGIIYYAAEKMRLEVKFDDDIKSEAIGTLENAKRCAEGPRPAPLYNSPLCPRCSMVNICLPDEINYCNNQNGKVNPRKIWPPRDDGVHVVVQQAGSKISVNGNTLKISDTDGNLIEELPLVNIESLALVGNVQITTQAIHALSEKMVPVAFMTSAGRTVALIDPLDSVSAETRKAQIRCTDNIDKCLELARMLILSKISNQRTMLRRNNQNVPFEQIKILTEMSDAVKSAHNLEEIRGYEGQAANIYFSNFPGMLKEPFAELFKKNGRQRRPPPDPVNSCLSLAYTMLTHDCVSALRIASLEPSIGVYHVNRPGRPALALDLMEPFRPLIGDSLVITGFNKGEFTMEDFEITSAGCVFNEKGRKAFFNLYSRRLATEIIHPVYGYRLSYRRMLVLHARLIAAWMRGELSALSFLTTR